MSRRTSSDTFVPHPIEWSPEQVRRFWDHYGSNPIHDDAYFAKQVGKALVSHVRRRIRIGTAVDIGCGHGDLMQILMNSGHDVYGVDQSPATVEQVQQRFDGHSRFKGAARVDGRIELPDESVDTAFLLEVVEHLKDDALEQTLREAHRVIRPGGHLVLTTPNSEDLRVLETMCPECGSIFHQVQHVRSWTGESLSNHVRPFGFEQVSADATVLSRYTGILGIAYGVAFQALGRGKPHLIYIGRRV